MSGISANDLKTRGISAVKSALDKDNEAVISVRGKPRYVVISIEDYERLREAEIFSAWQETRAAEARGDYVSETAGEHITRLQKDSALDEL